MNGSSISSTDEGTINLHTNLTTAVQDAYYILPWLCSGSLISVGVLCDHNCPALFSKTSRYISYDNQIVQRGLCSKIDGLYAKLQTKSFQKKEFPN